MKTITLNFIGKSSVPFNRTIEVSDELYEVIKSIKLEIKNIKLYCIM